MLDTTALKDGFENYMVLQYTRQWVRLRACRPQDHAEECRT